MQTEKEGGRRRETGEQGGGGPGACWQKTDSMVGGVGKMRHPPSPLPIAPPINSTPFVARELFFCLANILA